MKLSELHNCDKCKDKIVGITIDAFGISRCGYCGEIVNYKKFFEDKNLGDSVDKEE